MKNLLNKELRLAASPLTWAFLAFTGMTMLPGYPILVGVLFVCLGIFYSFQSAREANDILYTALLPLPKGDAVKSKFLFSCVFQLAAFLLLALLTLLRMTLLRDAPAYAANVMMPANPVFLAFALLMFAAFNLLFLGGFFRTGYGIGKPFVLFLAAAVVLMTLGETLHHIPALAALKANTPAAILTQCLVLIAAIAAYILLTLLSCRTAKARFENIDL